MTDAAIIARLLSLYGEATGEQRDNGRRWYDRFARGCSRIARETGTPVRRVVATAAITSPDAQLATNLRWTREACETRGAALVGEHPRDFQAIVWVVLRERGRARLVDIHDLVAA